MKSPARRAYADGPYGQVHFQYLGSGPTVVLFHQAPMTGFQYSNVIGPLAAEGFQVVAVDMPGFGMSDAVDHVPSVEEFARIYPAVLDFLGVEQAAVLGHHTGAMVVTEVALQFPDRVTAVVLNGPMPMTADERKMRLETSTPREKAMVAVPGGGHLTQLFQGRERMADGTVPPERLSEYVIQALMGPGEYWHGHHAAFQYRQEETIPRLRHRTLILTNTGDVIYEHAQVARALRPDFDYIELDGGGVDIVDQAVEPWTQAVAGFLRG